MSRRGAGAGAVVVLAAAGLAVVVLLALRGPLRLTGVVTDEDGRALAGARVLGAPDGGVGEFDRPSASAARTDSSGRFDLALPAGRRLVALRVEAEDSALGPATLRQLDAPKRGAMDAGTIVLRSKRVVAGRALDADAAPLAGARVDLLRSYFETQSGIVSATTDADGRFRLVSAERGMHLRITSEGFANAEVDLRTPPGDLDVVLEREAVVRGIVRDESGAAIAGASVRVFMAFRGMGGFTLETRSDSAGEFVVRGVREGRSSIEADALGFQTRSIALATSAGVETEVEFVLEQTPIVDAPVSLGREARLRGLLLDPAGRPLVAARLAIRLVSKARVPERETTTDVDGRFAFEGLPAGDYRGPIVFAEGLPRIERSELTPLAAGETRDVTIVVGHGRGVGGRVTANGEPVAGAWVVLHRDDGTQSFEDARALTSERGRFEIRGIGDGATRLSARAPGYRRTLIECPLSARGLAPVEIALERGAELEGRALLPNWAPAREARVFADFGDGEIIETYTDRHGRFRLTGLPEREGSFACYGAEGLGARSAIGPPFAPIEVRLTRR